MQDSKCSNISPHSSSNFINMDVTFKDLTVIYRVKTAVLYRGAETLSALPSIIVIKTLVAKVLATWQMIPARRVAIFSTPETRHRKLPLHYLIDWFLQGRKSVTVYLSDALAKQTGYVAEHPVFSHFLYFFSDWSSSSSVSVAFLLLWEKVFFKDFH